MGRDRPTKTLKVAAVGSAYTLDDGAACGLVPVNFAGERRFSGSTDFDDCASRHRNKFLRHESEDRIGMSCRGPNFWVLQ